ncbi:MAG: AMP-binding protein, partial [Burkholderiaceae bacterium]
MTTAADLLAQDFTPMMDLIRQYGRERGDHPALIWDGRSVGYAELDALADRYAAALQRDGIGSGDAVAICAAAS